MRPSILNPGTLQGNTDLGEDKLQRTNHKSDTAPRNELHATVSTLTTTVKPNDPRHYDYSLQQG